MTAPVNRLSEAELADLKLVAPTVLPEDTLAALKKHFSVEQLPATTLLAEKIAQGYILLHELRSANSGELLSSRMIVDYPGRVRGEVSFLLVSFAVTPDADKEADSKQNKSKGFGSVLRQKSYELAKRQRPHAFGFIAERETSRGVKLTADNRVRRAEWMNRLGILCVEGFDYQIPPLADSAIPGKLIPVSERRGSIKPMDLIVTRFDKKGSIAGNILKSIIERLYTNAYLVAKTDPFFIEQMSKVDVDKEYKLGIL